MLEDFEKHKFEIRDPKKIEARKIELARHIIKNAEEIGFCTRHEKEEYLSLKKYVDDYRD